LRVILTSADKIFGSFLIICLADKTRRSTGMLCFCLSAGGSGLFIFVFCFLFYFEINVYFARLIL